MVHFTQDQVKKVPATNDLEMKQVCGVLNVYMVLSINKIMNVNHLAQSANYRTTFFCGVCRGVRSSLKLRICTKR